MSKTDKGKQRHNTGATNIAPVWVKLKVYYLCSGGDVTVAILHLTETKIIQF